MAFYLYALPFGPWASLAIVIVLAILTFVPSRYLYPSLPGKFNRFVSILGIPLTIALVWIIFNLPGDSDARLDPTTLTVAWVSLIYPILYLGASWVDQRGPLDEAHRRPSHPMASRRSQSSASGSSLAALSSARASAGLGDVDEGEQQAADDEEGDDREDRAAAGARDVIDHGEVAGPKIPANFSSDPEEPEELARLVPRDQAGEERAAQGLRPALHRPDQDRQDQEMQCRSS